MNSNSPVGATLKTFSLRLFDADALSDAVRSSRFEHLQLEPGDFQAELKRIDVGRLRIDTGQYTRKVMARGDFPTGRVIVGCLLKSPEAGCINGYRFGLNDVVIFPEGSELDYVQPAATSWCSIQLTETLLKEAGCAAMTFDRVRVLPGNRPENVHLARLLGILTAARTAPLCPPDEEVLLEQVGRTLKEHLGRRARGRRPNLRDRMTLVRRFEQHARDHINTAVRIPALCTELGISQRTMEHIFKLEMGITPKQFVTVLRLNAVRQKLLRPSAEHETIAQVAAHHGISHLGRFATAYLQQFGELPSATRCASRNRLV